MSGNSRLRAFLKEMPEAQAAAGSDYSAVVREQQPYMLTFERKSRERFSLPYSVMDVVTFEPGMPVVVLFSRHRVTIRGVQLDAVFEALAARSASVLREFDDKRGTVKPPAAVAVIQEIVIEPRSSGDDGLKKDGDTPDKGGR